MLKPPKRFSGYAPVSGTEYWTVNRNRKLRPSKVSLEGQAQGTSLCSPHGSLAGISVLQDGHFLDPVW